MKGKKQTLLVLVLLLLVGVTSGYIANTYAKYASKAEKSGNATVAKWNFTNDIKNTTLTFDLKGTPTNNTLVDNKIAPGTKGTFDINLTNTSETGVDYTIKLKTIDNCPTNLKFYKEDPTDKTGDALTAIEMTTTDGKIIDHLDAKTGNDAPAKTVKIYWAWEYGTDDKVDTDPNMEDTTSGLAAAGIDENGDTVADASAKMTVNIEITGVQTQPTFTES